MSVRARVWSNRIYPVALLAIALLGCGEREQGAAAHEDAGKSGGGGSKASASVMQSQVEPSEGPGNEAARRVSSTRSSDQPGNTRGGTDENQASGKMSAQAGVNAAKPTISIRKLTGTGVGRSFDAALQNALLRVVEQVNGTSVSRTIDTESMVSDYRRQSNYSADLDISGKGAAAADGSAKGSRDVLGAKVAADTSGEAKGRANFELSGNLKTSSNSAGEFDANKSVVKVSVRTAGSVSRYQVLNSSNENGVWSVTILAEVPVYSASAVSKRIKLAVLPLRKPNTSSASDFEEALRNHIIDVLAQSGKVAILDREFGAEAERELSQLELDAFGKSEVAKMGNKLGADYVIVGVVRQAESVRSSVYVQALGRRVYGEPRTKAQTTFRVVEVATGVVLTSATIDGVEIEGGGLQAVAKEHATRASRKILEALYPIRIEAVSDDVFYMGRGGDEIKVGDQFRVLKQGTPIRDTDTGELLGYAEREVALVVVTEVQARLSKASTIGGAPLLSVADTKQLVARRVETPKSIEKTMEDTAQTATKPPRRSGQGRGDAPQQGVDY